jgi:hypothetical protein
MAVSLQNVREKSTFHKNYCYCRLLQAGCDNILILNCHLNGLYAAFKKITRPTRDVINTDKTFVIIA